MIKQGKGTKTRIPFGPFLSLAALVYLFFQIRFSYFISYISTAAYNGNEPL